MSSTFPTTKAIRTGTRSAVNQPDEWDFDPVRGEVWRLHYESAGPEGCQALYSLYRSQRIACSLRRSGVRSQLTATVSGSQLLDQRQDNWQLLNNVVQRSIFKSDLALTLEPGELAFIRATYDDLLQQEAASAMAAFDALPDDAIKTMLGYLLQGTTHFDVTQPVLRYSGSVSNFYLGDVDTSDSAMLLNWTTSSLLSTFPIPSFLSRRISSMGGPVIPRYQIGWLQMGSTLITDAQNRQSLSTEWVFDNWSTDFYPFT